MRDEYTNFFSSSESQSRLYREDIIDRLEALDAELQLKYPADIEASIIIVGGSALILLDMLTRYSHESCMF